MRPESFLFFFALIAAWVGHACIWTTLLNSVYARPYPKTILKPWRHFTGFVILAFPLLIAATFEMSVLPSEVLANAGPWGISVLAYSLIGLFFGAILFPVITVRRLRRKPSAVLLSESTQTLDLGEELGAKAIGDGKGRRAARLPFNCVFRVDFTELALALPNLPPEWDGLTILHVSDVHYHGTPSRAFHERVLAEIARRWPNPDLVCLTGDIVDTDAHHKWIVPLLGQLRGTDGTYAILGNHDRNHEPERIRAELTAAGYEVLGNGWREATIRGIPCVLVGHEGPWFSPPPDLAAAPVDCFRLGLSHTPDNFYWGQANRGGLMLCGHVHGGQIRLPLIGSIFVPSMYGRRFDMGVFEGNGTAMVVTRGLSGKEPLRFRCHPQVIRIRLKRQ